VVEEVDMGRRSEGHQPATDPPGSQVAVPAESGGGDAGASPAARRRRAIVAGHLGDTTTARLLLTDVDPSTRAAALAAVVRAGDGSDDDLLAGLSDLDAGVRRRAAELAGRAAAGLLGGELTVGSVLIAVLVDTLDDPDAMVAEAAAWALGEVDATSKRAEGDVGTALIHMAGHHDEPLCREAAIAALGSRGDPTTLPAVLAGLDDRPAIRRRAAVALAAFDDPLADAGLRRCLDDRDWQVRQVAEDLLAAR
jgi:HEAT repeat protein